MLGNFRIRCKELFWLMLFFACLAQVGQAQLGPCAATAEETVGNGPPLRIVVFGDSVAWGNGLKETGDRGVVGHKFSAIIADWITVKLNRKVERTVFAHSAAAIQPRNGTPNPSDTWPGDVNSSYPLIPDQLKCLSADQRQTVKLVLIDGCINDVDAFGVVDPSHDVAWVTKATTAFCGDPVKNLLSQAASLYPNAVIVVSGYYPIISGKSDIAPFLDFLRQFFPHNPALMSWQVEARKSRNFSVVQPPELLAALGTSAENSTKFYELSNQLLYDAADAANKQLAEKRVFFVKIPFTAENAFGASNSLLWPIPGTSFSNGTLGFDEEYGDRWAACWDAYGADLSGAGICHVDATAHPNVQGAQLYANEIEKVLLTIMNRL